ncbi:arylesterase [Pseudorhodoplanes sp.]|uniref:arylesterase n=1 Tax=Pseudorhodoplanes sp. TaxID=1934341 RepID=UPI002D7EF0AA|nr:arylesterase [Pseudorhodoplanes sp.]
MAESRTYGAMKSLVHSLTLTVLALAGFAVVLASPATAQNPAPIRIVAFGDSLTAGYGLPAQDAFPARLERALKAKGHNVAIENAGVSGDTASGGLSRLDWSIQDGTDAVIVELGANDMLRGVEPKVTRQALDDILAKLKARNIPVLLAGMRGAPNLGSDYVRDFEAIFPDLAQKHDVVFYPFFLDGVAAQSKLALRDGMHPNADGVDTIVKGILPKAEELVARVKKRAPG